MPYSTSAGDGSVPKDVTKYIEICRQGRLYEHLMRGMGWAGDKKSFKSEVWFLFLYGPNRSAEQCAAHPDPNVQRLVPLVQFFESEFPNVYGFMWERKRRNYKTLPCDMQRLESKIMIAGVCGRLAEEAPHVPVATIHDSIMTTGEHVLLVQRFIGDEFAKYGLQPTLNVESTLKQRPLPLRKAA